MPATQTATPKEELLARVASLSPAELSRVSDFIDALGGDEPNEETAAALRESADMRNLIGPFHPNEETIRAIEESRDPANRLGPYDSIEEMLEDFGIDVDAKSSQKF
jgi:hypothetical protein